MHEPDCRLRLTASDEPTPRPDDCLPAVPLWRCEHRLDNLASLLELAPGLQKRFAP